MKKLLFAMSLLVAMSLGSIAQAQGLGDLFQNQQGPSLQPPAQAGINQARLQEVEDLQLQLQQGERATAVAVGQQPQLPPQGQDPALPGEIPGQQIPGQQIPQGIPVQGPDQLLQGQIPAAQIQEGVGQAAIVEEAGPGVVVEEQLGFSQAVEILTQELSIGAVVQPLPGLGMKVVAVRPGSEAELIGLVPGTLIEAVNRIPISSAPQFEALLQQALELHLNRLNLLVRNANYGIEYDVPERSILQLKLVQEYQPVVVQKYVPYGGYYNEYHNDDHHYDHGHIEYVRPRRVYGGGCHR